jgi:predicted DNA-binding transcriptional regulator YafY
MRASRLLSILMLLQTRGRMSAPALAAELEVTHRTILRDIDQLSAAGVPVWSERGRDGGFQLREGWSTQLTGLTELEAQALSLAGVPSAATDLGMGSASASAHLKMLAALPATMRDDAQRVSARLHFDPIDWYRLATPPEHLQAVAGAVWHQRIVAMRYESWSGPKDRVVKPLGLVLKAGIWYMAASVETAVEAATEPRIYRLSNIQKITVRQNTFRYPRNFNLANFWQTATQRFESEIFEGEATIRITARGIKKLAEVSAAMGQAAAKSATPDAKDKNWSVAVIPIEAVEQAAGQLMSIGAELQVLKPPALRAHIRDLLLRLATYYRD